MTTFNQPLITKNQPDSVTFYVQNIEGLLKNISPIYWQTTEFAPNWQSTTTKKLPISIDVLTSGHGTVTIDANFLANIQQEQQPLLLLENVQQQNNNSWPDEPINPVFQTKNSYLGQKKILESFFVVENSTPFKQNPYIPTINTQVVGKNEFVPFLESIIETLNETDNQTEPTVKEPFETEDAMLFRKLLEQKKNDPGHFLTSHNKPVDLEMEMVTKPKQMAQTGSDNTGKMTFYIENLHAMLEKVAPDFSHTKGLAQNIAYSDPRFPLTIHLDTDGHGTVTFEKQVLTSLPDDNNALQGLLTYFNNELIPKNGSKTLPFLTARKKKVLSNIYQATFDLQAPSKFFVLKTKKLNQGALQYEPQPDIYIIGSLKFEKFLGTVFNTFYMQGNDQIDQQKRQIEAFQNIKKSKKTETKLPESVPKKAEPNLKNKEFKATMEKFKKAVENEEIQLRPTIDRRELYNPLERQKRNQVSEQRRTERRNKNRLKTKYKRPLIDKMPFFKK
ncbi:hypothetical protein IPH25_04520 [bacterium]|nr:MAG: hypothetical protein IPG37_01515 [bacterium]QQR61707.1 MAG: hypothetical protein IPH25_04520 [bacterium]QQR62725.1 MAG: hypothetical protein IPH67_04915 [bacterium]